MVARLCVLPLLLMFMSYPATAGTYGWGSVASPSRIAGTKLTGVVSIQEVAGTNGIVQQFFVRTDGSPRVRTLAVGKQTAAIPPTGTPVSGNLGKLGWIYGTPFTGSSFHGSTSVAGGTVYFSGVACTDEWICYKGVYLQKCMDAACSKYLIPEGAITFEEPAGIQIDTQGAVASLDGWVFLLKVEVDKNNTKSYGVWARDVKAGLPAKRLATGVVGSILLSEKMELEPGLGGQVTIVFPEKQRAFLYIPDQEKWNPLP